MCYYLANTNIISIFVEQHTHIKAHTMKTINKTAAKVMNKLIARCNETGEGHVKIDNTEGAFMPVFVEKLQSIDLAGRPVTIFSVAHYYEQNGDLVPDPDMTFAVSDIDPMYIWPMTYNTLMGQENGIYFADKQWRISESLQYQHAVFAGMWMKNIKCQQDL